MSGTSQSKRRLGLIVLIAAAAIVIYALIKVNQPVQDAAKRAGKTTADFPQTASRVLDDMDGGIELTEEERKGRNTWILWTAGNDGFWNYLSKNSFGILDLLKTVSSDRNTRFAYLGLINEPGFKASEGNDPYGVRLDERVAPKPDDLDEKVYGRSTGIVGLRLFDNPAFDEKAKKHWDAERYYNDPIYYTDPKLERPYRVGMSCGFCHVSFSPLNPPEDPESPSYANLSSNIGAEYFWTSRVLGDTLSKDNFIHQLMENYPPGALDTSLIASDNINGPRTMNAVFNVVARLQAAKEFGANEKQAGGNLDVPGVKNGVPGVQDGIQADGTLTTPHVLKDGADSVGLAGALARVFINIGEFHEQWVQNFTPLLGGKQTPFDVANANENSVYWQATGERLKNLAAFFVKASGAMHLEDAPGGEAYLTKDEVVLTTGKNAFADKCASCHSSKRPDAKMGDANYQEEMRKLVQQADFRDNNFLSTDKRYSIAELKMNACSSLATNAISGHIWDSFSSQTYKDLPSVGDIQVTHPLDGTTSSYTMPAGGRGYIRAASLASLWTSAPFFLNNSLGGHSYLYDEEGTSYFKKDVASIAGRMAVFDDATRKLLWPETREAKMYRTDRESYLIVSVGVLPKVLRVGLELKGKKELRIGPIPKGTPVSLLANIDMEADPKKLIKAISKLTKALLKIKKDKLDEAQSTALLTTLVPDLLAVSKCPDFVVNRGHEYGSDLPDEDKLALIEFLKTL